jgi:CRP-like cAMP-binding protein
MTQAEEKSNHGAPRIEHSLVRALRAVPSLSSLDDAELLSIAGESANLAWAAGSQVIASGTPADGLYIVLSGRVQVLEPGGTEVSTLGPGEYVGEFSLLLGNPRRHDVVALEDVELMVVPSERIDTLMAEHPDLAREVRAQLQARLAENARAGAEPPA